MPRTNHTGTLRAEVTLIEGGASIDWIDPQTREVIWSETCKPKPGFSFASQIECMGDFCTRDGYFIDQDGKRHFVMYADIGLLGAIMQQHERE